MERHLQWTAWEDLIPHIPYEYGCWGKSFLHCGTTHILVQGNQIHRLWTWLSCPDIPHSHQSSSGTPELPSSASSHCKKMLPFSGSDWFDDIKYTKYVSVTWTGEYTTQWDSCTLQSLVREKERKGSTINPDGTNNIHNAILNSSFKIFFIIILVQFTFQNPYHYKAQFFYAHLIHNFKVSLTWGFPITVWGPASIVPRVWRLAVPHIQADGITISLHTVLIRVCTSTRGDEFVIKVPCHIWLWNASHTSWELGIKCWELNEDTEALLLTPL